MCCLQHRIVWRKSHLEYLFQHRKPVTAA
jgi:hypothetical protein